MKLNATKDGRKAILRPGGTGKNPGGILLLSITTTMDPAPIDQGNLIEEVIGTLIRDMILRIQIALIQLDRLQPTAVYCHRRGV